ncbi:DNA-binding transcriptional activator BglJ, partial [Escherichia coli]|nr:DNA-binding transcriptional activator BglJ [Escherichia coli]
LKETTCWVERTIQMVNYCLISLALTQATDRLNNQWYINQSRTLSPTEREILRFMSRGYSMTQIAEQLKRNIKTIRAHKFNVMSKLGVSSDAGLLEAADILLCMRHCEASNVLHPY